LTPFIISLCTIENLGIEIKKICVYSDETIRHIIEFKAKVQELNIYDRVIIR